MKWYTLVWYIVIASTQGYSSYTVLYVCPIMVYDGYEIVKWNHEVKWYTMKYMKQWSVKRQMKTWWCILIHYDNDDAYMMHTMMNNIKLRRPLMILKHLADLDDMCRLWRHEQYWSVRTLNDLAYMQTSRWLGDSWATGWRVDEQRWWFMTLIHSPSMKSKSCDMHSLWEFKHIVDELWGSWWSGWWSKVEVDNLDHDKLAFLKKLTHFAKCHTVFFWYVWQFVEW